MTDRRRRRSAVAVLAAAALVVVIGACGGDGAARAMTPYETYQYSVSVPTDLGLAPLNPDPAYVWANPKVSFAGRTATPVFGFLLGPVPACDSGTMLATAQTSQARVTLTEGTEPVPVTYGTMPGAVYTAKMGAIALVVAVACSGTMRVEVFGEGVSRPDIDAIMATFRFRDPPGDPAHPPSARPSG